MEKCFGTMGGVLVLFLFFGDNESYPEPQFFGSKHSNSAQTQYLCFPLLRLTQSLSRAKKTMLAVAGTKYYPQKTVAVALPFLE